MRWCADPPDAPAGMACRTRCRSDQPARCSGRAPTMGGARRGDGARDPGGRHPAPGGGRRSGRAIHLVFFKGEPSGGDLVLWPARAGLGAILAAGAGQQPTGRGDRDRDDPAGGQIHPWVGADESTSPGTARTAARPRNPAGARFLRCLYTRVRPGWQGLRALLRQLWMQRTSALDGGGTIAADDSGHVYVAWHGRTEDAGPGEAARRMWVVRSEAMMAATFASAEEPGAGASDRGLRLLRHAGPGRPRREPLRALSRGQLEMSIAICIWSVPTITHAHSRGESIHPWRAEICPMSSATLAESGPGALAAWETRGQVYFSRIDPRTHRAGPPTAPAGGRGNRKHPAVAGNARGETILVWTEGTGWQKGGSLAWQVFDLDWPTRRPRGSASRTAYPSGAWRPSSPGPTAGFASFIEGPAPGPGGGRLRCPV